MTQSHLTLLHCADLHLDGVLGDSISANQLNELSREEQTRLRDAPLLALDKIAKIATSEKVDIVLIAGDVFNRRDGVSSDIRTRSAFTNFLRTLSDLSIQVFIALGNHDPLNTISDLSAPWPQNVHLFSSRAPETHKLKIDSMDVAIHGVSYENNEESRNLAGMFPPKIENSINIGVLHTNVGGNEIHSNYAPSSVESLQSKRYDYFALGHIHKRNALSEHPLISYSGNTQALSAKPSESEPKGCVVVRVNFESRTVEHEFFPTDSVRYKKIEIDLPQDLHKEDITNYLSNAIRNTIQPDSYTYLLRLKINVYDQSKSFDAKLLKTLINEQRANFVVTKIILNFQNSKEDIFSSHAFFDIVSKKIESTDIPPIEEIYGKKSESISSLLESKAFEGDLVPAVKEYIESIYMSQSSLSAGSTK